MFRNQRHKKPRIDSFDTCEHKGMELDYYNEAANAEEFAMRHAFLPFVTSPGWIPELMGPPESSRVLALTLGRFKP